MSGIIGLNSISNESVADELYLGTVALQHRGEEGCGIGYESNGKLHVPKQRCLAYYFFRDNFDGLSGLREIGMSTAIGHTLYEDTGGLQPVNIWGESHILTLAMDGVLLGYDGSNDSVMRTKLSREIDNGSDIYDAVGKVMDDLEGRGSYCVTALVKQGDDLSMVAFRDPKGIKPLAYGKKGQTYVVASESKAIRGLEGELLGDVKPGEVIIVSNKGFEKRRIREQDSAHCFFEWIYFADPTSVIEGRNVYEVRKDLGRKLAERHHERLSDVDLVMASPDSGRGVAMGFQQGISEVLGRFVPYEEACVKNPGAKRTFQVEDPEERKLAARVKFYINEDVVRGKNVAVGDDSIVRGTVFRDGMIEKLRRAGAGKIYAVISCPALLHACIKDPTSTEFAARGLDGNVVELGAQVAQKINADFVCYPTIEEMMEVIGVEGLCKACVDGEFPVDERFYQIKG